MSYQAIEICQPSAIVAQQVLELGEAWLADAVRTATSAVRCGGPPRGPLTSDVHVRIGSPCGTQQLLRLPMEWEVADMAGAGLLRGELDVLQTGPTEARIEVNMAAPPELLPAQDWERAQLEQSIEIATRSFLQRLFWTLQALTHYDLLGHQAIRTPTTHHLRGSQR